MLWPIINSLLLSVLPLLDDLLLLDGLRAALVRRLADEDADVDGAACLSPLWAWAPLPPAGMCAAAAAAAAAAEWVVADPSGLWARAWRQQQQQVPPHVGNQALLAAVESRLLQAHARADESGSRAVESGTRLGVAAM